ncbi:MAG TPA: phosphoheptose isomerase [Chitinophagaceae bacterium]|nr:phosphoheptose isomerase [Chitinophagaceae bacterium]HRF26698.1 hypothetical protein [Ferruginibacter sp.]
MPMETSQKFSEIRSYLEQMGLKIISEDQQRPWGGFFVIDEEDAEKFIHLFFPILDQSVLLSGKLSPKILLVAPGKKLSWQYHHRRSEIWRLIDGEAAISRSYNDAEGLVQEISKGEIIELDRLERHRLIGLSDWGVIAEIWRHSNADDPSNEEDIVRLQDDFGR